jgi:hypothetical protein
MCFSTGSLYAQNNIIRGRVINNYLETLPYVSIAISDTIEVGKTDLNGFFKINIPDSVKRISFRAVGADLASVEIAHKCTEIEVIMISSSTYDFMTPRKVEKLQLKKFKKLPKIHEQAFKKGLFKIDKACYRREYTPFY